MTHDQNLKNFILDYPRQAIALFAASEAQAIDADARVTPGGICRCRDVATLVRAGAERRSLGRCGCGVVSAPTLAAHLPQNRVPASGVP